MPPLASPATVCCANVALCKQPTTRKMHAASKNTATGLETTGADRTRPPESGGARRILPGRVRRQPSVTEVAPAHRLVLPQLRARPRERDAADLQDIGGLRCLQCDVCVLFDDEDGRPVPLVEFPDDPEDL